MSKKLLSISLALTTLLTGCAMEGHNTLPTESVATYQQPYYGVKSSIAIGQFNNSSTFMNGAFFEGQDQLSNRAKTLLIADLQQTGRFNVLDRANMKQLAAEAKLSGQKLKLQGAHYVVTGNITGFGRKTVGDQELFGILGRGKKQVAYSQVTLNVVNVQTSQVVYSVQGAGEYNLSNREILGFGSTASYDATLNDKVLGLSIRDAVNKLVAGIQQGQWTPSK
ncbi:hypothetical protein A6A19_05340 [Actinobacillus delphinicola]|uniref:Curli production assembly/transport component CsgG n=1 Tax=Actinobacillus delphinicola TaxID=51161 RepID=A0A448TTM0_9PAST|nr:CsgG/HfaB family protein [Actinobacillus delphinicola]MDG6897421.1 hypothetical protein [Actinobacillus delphinicola]VEJ09357.1 putative lipoprotein [Actinobacillus delphinicola]